MEEFLFYWKKCLNAYTKFDGRARRKEYWMFVAVNAVASIAASIIDSIIFDRTPLVSWLYSLAILVPGLAVSFRRLHDIGKSGVCILLALIPVVGWIILILWAIKEGDQGDNEYGPDPKLVGEIPEENII
ncbi:MAG: DUF805 domain-containing protein [Ignavibacteria bacterium]|jgi:uncharacterized membrane protein YhaH (DUF805 family)|nr:DUF805 domain-containing protein [Ignavibacteria bacterium]